jgi:hypothetical protein
MQLRAELDAVTELQGALIDALDRQDVAAIEQSSAQLAKAVSALRRHGAIVAGQGALDAANHALRQNDAARSRILFLGERNRQKLDRLGTLRRQSSSVGYKSYI